MSGKNIEEAFFETAREIYQNVSNGRLDYNNSESSVQHKPQDGRTSLTGDTQNNKNNFLANNQQQHKP
jgi:hypothetical protein